MLKNVHLKNLALIKEADIDLCDGLNILTGETGAGKSIFFGSVNIALGSKANKSLISTGENSAIVELIFESDDTALYDALNALDIEADGKNVIITRKITESSGISKINGETVTLSNLRRITTQLVDFHGQNDHQSLLDPIKQLALVDDFGGKELKSIKLSLGSEYGNYRNLRRSYRDFDKDEEALKKDADLLKHELNEIQAADLHEDEDEALEAEYKKLSRSEGICADLIKAVRFLDGENGAQNNLGFAARQINGAFEADTNLRSINDSILEIESLAADISRDISDYIEKNRFDEKKYAEVKERLDLINNLKSKYGQNISDILDRAAVISTRLDDFEHYFERKRELENKISESAVKLNSVSKDLSALRKKSAKRLESAIISHLNDLNFLDVRFKIDFTKNKTINENGFDKIEFLISVNPGEELKPLAKIASGGEMSRVMLAIKSAIAEDDNIPTLIFDEIDTGISGRTAQKVAEKLNLLSRNHQLICITHLPQIAAMADAHYLIDKAALNDKTVTSIKKLNFEESVGELARLLGGKEITDATLKNASEMKRQAAILKSQDL